MGVTIETITKVLDDRDGKELPQDTQPVFLRFGQTEWKLYLSEDNQDDLKNFLKEFTESAEVLAGGPRTGVSKRKPSVVPKGGANQNQVREWALSNDIEVHGKRVNPQGRISNDFIHAYNAVTD